VSNLQKYHLLNLGYGNLNVLPIWEPDFSWISGLGRAKIACPTHEHVVYTEAFRVRKTKCQTVLDYLDRFRKKQFETSKGFIVGILHL